MHVEPTAAGAWQPERPSTTGDPVRGPRPLLPAGRRIEDYTQRDIQRLAAWIVSDGVHRTNEELLREVMGELGFHKMGRRIHKSIVTGISRARARRTA
jgi:hypothetical protein